MSAYIDERPSGDQREAAIDARGKTFEPPREIVGDQDRVGRFRDVDERAVAIEEERHRLPRHPIRKRRRERAAVRLLHPTTPRSTEYEDPHATGRTTITPPVSTDTPR